jgi:hypothetical protein
MAAMLALDKTVCKQDVELAWATYRSLIIAEADDPKRQDDEAHQRAILIARNRYQQLYREWVAQ